MKEKERGNIMSIVHMLSKDGKKLFMNQHFQVFRVWLQSDDTA